MADPRKSANNSMHWRTFFGKGTRLLAFGIALALTLNLTVCASEQARGIDAYNEMQWTNVDLNQYPSHIHPLAKGEEISIGDLHGNALKMMYFLVYYGIMDVSQNDYQAFVKIYNKDIASIQADDLHQFEEILRRASFNLGAKVRSLGDDLCDRGSNDYFTLKIYQKMDEAGVEFDVVLSNHGNFFLEAYERPEKDFGYNPYGEGKHESTVRSMLNMQKLIDRGLIEKSEVIRILEQHYLKDLGFPGVTYNATKKDVTVYSHAPIDLSMLKSLAKEFAVSFDDSSIKALLKSIDAINQRVKALIKQGQWSHYYQTSNATHKKLGTKSPLKQVLWNRDYAILDRYNQAPEGDYTINYVHGHDSDSHVFDLDTSLGKGSSRAEGPLAVYLSHEQ